MPMMNHPHIPRAQQGFTLVVVAALFIAFAVVGAAAIERAATLQLVQRRAAAADQLSRLATAIIEYSVFSGGTTYNLYPCPAKLDVVVDTSTAGSADFGKAVTNCYDTTGDVTATALTSTGIPVLDSDGDGVINGDNEYILRGMVPVLELSPYGITTNDAFDPWNNRIMYVINRTLTLGSSGPDQTQNPSITDKRTGYTIAAPDFILISYGRDGKGGHRKSVASTTPSVSCSSASTVLREENCDTADKTFWVAPTYTASSATTSTYFDDILTWYRQ